MLKITVTIPAKRNGELDRKEVCDAYLLGRTYIVRLPLNDWLNVVKGQTKPNRDLAFSHPRSAPAGRFNLTGGGSHYLQPYFDKTDVVSE